jgi:hypothetical protein
LIYLLINFIYLFVKIYFSDISRQDGVDARAAMLQAGVNERGALSVAMPDLASFFAGVPAFAALDGSSDSGSDSRGR